MGCLSSCFEDCYRKRIKQEYAQVAYRSHDPQGSTGCSTDIDHELPKHLSDMWNPQFGGYSGPLPSLESPCLQMTEYRPHRPTLTTASPQLETLTYGGQLEFGKQKQEEQAPSLHFSVLSDPQHQVLFVHLSEAANLPSNKRKICDPFVVLRLLPKRPEALSSKVVSDTLYPNWNEKFPFSGLTHEEVQQQTLVLRVYHYNKYSRDEFIGGVVLPLADADIYGVPVQKAIDEDAIDPQTDNMGDLLISLHYNQVCEVIQGTLLKATNLMRPLRNHSTLRVRDSYVRVNVLHKGKRLHKWKSSVQRNTLLPIFNESFEFEVFGLDLRRVTLQAMVMEYVWFGRDDHVGTVLIGENVEQESGKVHWGQVMGSLRQPVSHWHTVLADPIYS